LSFELDLNNVKIHQRAKYLSKIIIRAVFPLFLVFPCFFPFLYRAL